MLYPREKVLASLESLSLPELPQAVDSMEE